MRRTRGRLPRRRPLFRRPDFWKEPVVMVGPPAHPRILERATKTLRNRQAQQLKAVTAINHAIELTQELNRTSGFAACDVLIAGFEQVLTELNAISPTAPPSAESLKLLIARINTFGGLFALLAQLSVVTGSLGTRAHTGASRNPCVWRSVIQASEFDSQVVQGRLPRGRDSPLGPLCRP